MSFLYVLTQIYKEQPLVLFGGAIIDGIKLFGGAILDGIKDSAS
jgi:hypothetical protein